MRMYFTPPHFARNDAFTATAQESQRNGCALSTTATEVSQTVG
jgi:hypothetical protein